MTAQFTNITVVGTVEFVSRIKTELEALSFNTHLYDEGKRVEAVKQGFHGVPDVAGIHSADYLRRRVLSGEQVSDVIPGHH